MKTFEKRLQDYVMSHPFFDANSVYDHIYQQHKKAIWKAQHRIEERLENMLASNASVLFLTITFDDEHLPIKEQEFDTESQVYHYLRLQPGIISFVANTDYGKKNGRFHWHAVVLTTRDVTHHGWNNGSVDFVRVKKSSVPLRLSRYIVKLKQHATKILDPILIYYPVHYKAKGGE